MHDIKRKRFATQHPGVEFPTIEPVSANQATALRICLASAAHFPPEVDNLALTHHLDSILRPVDNHDARAPDFNLADVARDLGIDPKKWVYVNWYRYDRLDKIDFESLVKYFPSIWYPSSDDIELFDDTCSWILGIDHTGGVAAITF